VATPDDDDSDAVGVLPLVDGMESHIRPRCPGCEEYLKMCLCRALPEAPLATAGIRFLILQHPNEARTKNNSINRTLTRILRDVEVVVGRYYTRAGCPPLDRAMQEDDTILLYPRPNAKPLQELLRSPPTTSHCTAAKVAGDRLQTIIVVDGTWSTANGIITTNRVLSEWPNVAKLDSASLLTARPQFLTRIPPSRIPGAVSTAEAIAAVIQVAHDAHQGAPAGSAAERPRKDSLCPAARAVLGTLQQRVRNQLDCMPLGTDSIKHSKTRPGYIPPESFLESCLELE